MNRSDREWLGMGNYGDDGAYGIGEAKLGDETGALMVILRIGGVMLAALAIFGIIAFFSGLAHAEGASSASPDGVCHTLQETVDNAAQAGGLKLEFEADLTGADAQRVIEASDNAPDPAGNWVSKLTADRAVIYSMTDLKTGVKHPFKVAIILRGGCWVRYLFAPAEQMKLIVEEAA